ncbi:MAG: CUB domain-containing protein [Flavobacteriales bacterium]|nr:CUB domain-containing protein [Flavobacteriales bacterium]
MKHWIPTIIGSRCLLSGSVFAQGDFYMSNATINDCYGNFFDSDLGMPAGNYDHNENLTFTICVPQATQITMIFSQFCTEAVLDYIRFYDGPDTLSPLIFGPWSGGNTPPPIVATSGCLTINFISDVSVAWTGWIAEFFSDVPPPVPPNITNVTGTCSSNQLTVDFDGPIDCDSLNTGAFALTGTPGYAITSVSPNPCVNDSATSVIIGLDNPISDCASFGLDFDLTLADACDSLHFFTLTQAFDVFDCPLDVDLLTTTDSLCGGGCADLSASVSGGDCNYSFVWNNGWPNSPGPHALCTSTDSTVFVTVTDGQGLLATDTISIFAIDAPVAGPDTSVCDSYGLLQLIGASPAGGVYSGPGIVSPT